MSAVAWLLGLVVVVQLASIRTSWGWNLTGHRWIALDALTALPDPMREALTRGRGRCTVFQRRSAKAGKSSLC